MELLVCARLYREKFNMESFCGLDDVLLLVTEGSFIVKSGREESRVEKLQGYHFQKGVLYERKIIDPVTMILFRYRAQASLFCNSHLVFRDVARIRSTAALLERCASVEGAQEMKAHFLIDLASQYAVEQSEMCAVRRYDARITKAEQIMRASLCSPLSLSLLAEQVGLSHVQFIRRFREVFGKTPSAYIAALRLERAKELLSETEFPIKKIAALCGFENEYYFSNFFKQHIGCSPSAYRSMTV